MKLARALPAVLALCLVVAPRPGLGQAGTPRAVTQPLQVFLDCHGPCDFDHLRREITYVAWVRDRQDADVHLLLTTQGTGGGGQEFTLKLIGLRSFSGADDEFVFTSRQSDTDDEIRSLIAQRIGLALARYAARSPAAGRLRLTFEAPEEDEPAPGQAARDPWNLWVFELGGSADIERESEFRSTNLAGEISARRVTEQWKLGMFVHGERTTSRFQLEDSSFVHSKRSNYAAAVLVVRSLGEHWSLGLNAGARRSSRENYDLLLRVAPGLEYDLFPYRESSRRQLVLVYEVGIAYANYHEETIFSKLSETRPIHALTAALEAVQPWGNVDALASVSTHLDRWSQNRVQLETGLELRLARGLELDLEASYSRVRDQLSLAKEGASPEEILLQLKQLRTSYTFELSVGLNYTFGSRFNNVVNPRFDSARFDF